MKYMMGDTLLTFLQAAFRLDATSNSRYFNVNCKWSQEDIMDENGNTDKFESLQQILSGEGMNTSTYKQ
jgi:hypothetical protein